MHTSHSNVDDVAFLSSHFTPVLSTVWCLIGVCNFAGSSWLRPLRNTCLNIFVFDLFHHSPSSQSLQSLTADLNGIKLKELLPVWNNLRESFIYDRDTEKQILIVILIIVGLNCQKIEINLFLLNNINTEIQIWLLLTSCLRAAEVNLYYEQQQHRHHCNVSVNLDDSYSFALEIKNLSTLESVLTLSDAESCHLHAASLLMIWTSNWSKYIIKSEAAPPLPVSGVMTEEAERFLVSDRQTNYRLNTVQCQQVVPEHLIFIIGCPSLDGCCIWADSCLGFFHQEQTKKSIKRPTKK